MNKSYLETSKKYLAGLLMIILLTGLAITMDNTLAKAEDRRDEPAKESIEQKTKEYKCYKSIKIKPGDTLWKIASEYEDTHYNTTQDYIDELKKINGLISEQIDSGSFLTVPYYDACSLND